ncbi:MAG: EscF/YscF/HrpA family type III secretion system needle major subunit [Candidatus Methylacidiphilales bacterium]|nr:EscF/YscF/HrpA family type III secretion system needle major subunit [Candidatus Methylacidiphilales bacterium]
MASNSFSAGGMSGTGLNVGAVYDAMGAANKTLEGNIRSFQQTMDPNSQMDLIQLQKLMQDWTIQTQLQSNVIKSMGDALKNSVSNLR